MLADAGAGVPNLQEHAVAALAAADKHRAVLRVANGVRHQVAQDALDQQRIGMHRVPGAAQVQRQALLEGRRLEVQTQLAEDVADLEVLRIHRHAAAVDARDVEQFREQFFERIDRGVDAVDQVRDLVVVALVAQGLGEQSHGMQGLPQIVAGGGEELRLGAVGGLGAAPRRIGGLFFNPELHEQFVGVHLEIDHALQGLPVVAGEHRGQAHDEQQDACELVGVGRPFARDAHCERPETQGRKRQVDARLRRQHRHSRHTEGVDEDDQPDLLNAVAMRIEDPRRDAPQRARTQRAEVAVDAPALKVGQRLGRGALELAPRPGPCQPDGRKRHEPWQHDAGRRDRPIQERDDPDAGHVAGQRRRHVVVGASNFLGDGRLAGPRTFRQLLGRRGGGGDDSAH